MPSPRPPRTQQERASKQLPSAGQHFNFGALRPWEEIVQLVEQDPGGARRRLRAACSAASLRVPVAPTVRCTGYLDHGPHATPPRPSASGPQTPSCCCSSGTARRCPTGCRTSWGPMTGSPWSPSATTPAPTANSTASLTRVGRQPRLQARPSPARAGLLQSARSPLHHTHSLPAQPAQQTTSWCTCVPAPPHQPQT